MCVLKMSKVYHKNETINCNRYLTMPKFTLHSICINTKKVYILNFVFLKKFTFPFGPF